MAGKDQTVQNLATMIGSLDASQVVELQNMIAKMQVNDRDTPEFRSVTRAMQSIPRRRIIKRSMVGISTALKNKWEGTKGTNSPFVSKALRLMGGDEAAKWIDRYFGKEVIDPKRVAKSREDQSVEKTVEKSIKVSDKIALKGYKNLAKRMDFMRKDIQDIKSLLMPKGVVARNRKGETKFVQYNPMAPEGERFQTITENGQLTPIKPGKEFEESAKKKAAYETAKLALKIVEEDKKREKYRWKDKKETFNTEDPLTKVEKKIDDLNEKVDGLKDKKGGLFQTLLTMLSGLMGWLWTRFQKILNPVLTIVRGIWTVFKPLLKGVHTIVRGIWTVFKPILKGMWSVVRVIGQGIGSLLGKFGFPVPALLAGTAAVATTGAMAVALDKGMKQVADKAVDGVLQDVTRRQEAAGISPEDSYAVYKQAMETSLASDFNKSEERQAYLKQQWQNSEGLSDMERGMARRFFYEREGGAKGPSTRGGRRGSSTPVESTPAAETIPADVAAVGSDTVDTNYPTTPVEEVVVSVPRTPPKVEAVGGTGTLSKGTSASVPYDLVKNSLGIDSGTWDAYRNTIASIESGGRYDIAGGAGKHYDGRYQLGKVAKQDAASLLGIPFPGHDKDSREQFRSNPAMQEQMFAAFTAANHKYLMAKSQKYKGLSLREKLEVLGYAHNQGWSGAKKWLESGEVGADAFGTKGTKYSEALAKNLPSTPALTPVMAGLGPKVDGESRINAAANQPAAVMAMLAPQTTVVNNTSPAPRRSLNKADTTTRDSTLIRTAGRDIQHPAV